jgi:hypothetical protein
LCQQSNGFPPGGGAPAQAKQAMSELLDGLRADERLAGLLQGLRRLPDPGYSDGEWALIQALFSVLKAAVAHLGVVFMEQGRVDFSEMALAARRALGPEDEPSDLALRLDYQIRHLLVDEFQDTSRSQHDLFRALTAGWQPGDGRTLFLVGDPMQSIYRFRQAEVGLYLDAWEGRLGGVALEPLRLSVNFARGRASSSGSIGSSRWCCPPRATRSAARCRTRRRRLTTRPLPRPGPTLP